MKCSQNSLILFINCRGLDHKNKVISVSLLTITFRYVIQNHKFKQNKEKYCESRKKQNFTKHFNISGI